MTEPGKPDTEAIKERAALAKALLEDKAFQYATLELRKRWFQELLKAGGGNSVSIQLCAQVNALEAVATELAVLINDYRMLARKHA